MDIKILKIKAYQVVKKPRQGLIMSLKNISENFIAAIGFRY